MSSNNEQISEICRSVKSFRARLDELSAEEKEPAEAIDQPEEESSQRTNTRKKEENMDSFHSVRSAQKVIDLTKTSMDSQQKYIKELETTASFCIAFYPL